MGLAAGGSFSHRCVEVKTVTFKQNEKLKPCYAGSAVSSDLPAVESNENANLLKVLLVLDMLVPPLRYRSQRENTSVGMLSVGEVRGYGDAGLPKGGTLEWVGTHLFFQHFRSVDV